MSYNAYDKHKILQKEESSLVLETCLHENPSAEYTILIGVLPFFHILNPHNINLTLCKASTFDSYEEREHQKENDNREDSQFLKE